MYLSKPCGSCHVSQFGRCRPNLSYHRSSNPPKRVHRIASAVASADYGIINRLIGSPLLQLDHNRSVIPLLQPVEHQLPFAAALLVHHPSSRESPPGAYSNHSHASDSDQHTTSLVELSYVLSGSGHFTSKSGETQLVSAGDSILAILGEISFAAGSPSTASAVTRSAATTDVSSSKNNSKQHPITSYWADSITWLKHHTTIPQPQNLLNHHQHHHHQHPQQQQQRQQQQRQQHLDPHSPANADADADSHTGQQQQLVMLQLLLPSELLTGELDHHHPYHLQEVEQQSPWAYAVQQQQQQQQQGSQSSSRIDQHSVCELLSGALGPPEPQQEQQQQEQDLVLSWSGNTGSTSSSHQMATSGSIAPTDNGNGSTDSHSSSSSSSHGSQSISSNGTSSSSSSSLPALRAQASSCVKRALAEVKAFQLPAQTNRLALLFGPHASPAVCLSFGVEVFEPGHVTPLHIHDNAHELFFVLAGKGVGVHGPGSGKAEEQPDLQQLLLQQQQDCGEAQHADQQQQQDRSSGGVVSGIQRVELSAGDVAVFPPGVLHGVDNPTDQQLYCLQMMLPNDSFVEWVRSGQAAGALDVAALQQLAAAASCGAQ